MTRGDWKRAARQGGPGWTIAGVLFFVAVVVAILRNCLER